MALLIRRGRRSRQAVRRNADYRKNAHLVGLVDAAPLWLMDEPPEAA